MKSKVRVFKETIDLRSSFFRRLKSHKYYPYLILVTVFLTAACVHTWQRFRVLDLVHEVAVQRAANRSLIDENRNVRAAISSLSLAERIQRYAIDSLGLEHVSIDRVFTLRPEESSVDRLSDFEKMTSALDRIVGNMPYVTGSQATASELNLINYDSIVKAQR